MINPLSTHIIMVKRNSHKTGRSSLKTHCPTKLHEKHTKRSSLTTHCPTKLHEKHTKRSFLTTHCPNKTSRITQNDKYFFAPLVSAQNKNQTKHTWLYL